MTGFADCLRQAIAQLQAGRSSESGTLLESICRMQAATVSDWFVQGVAHHWLGRLDAALAAFDQALRLDPSHLDALNARGAVLQALGRSADARATYERALDFAPGNAQLLTNLAIVLEALPAIEDALSRYEEALAAEPTCRPALLNLSALLLRLDRPREAHLVAERLVAAHPNAAEAHLNLAEALLALDRYAQAQTHAECALSIAPTSVPARISHAVALSCQGWFDAASASFRLARATDPATFARAMQTVWARGDPARANWPRGIDALPDPRIVYLARGAFRLARCEWSDRETFLAQAHRIVRDSETVGAPICEWALPFASTWLPLDDDVRFAIARAVGSAIDRATAPQRLAAPVRPKLRTKHLRIGYITPDARDHPNVTLTAPLIARHDRDRYEVIGYVLNAPDEHPMAAQFRASFNQVRECHEHGDAAIARCIRDDGIDILVDLAGYTEAARPEVAAMRPARIHCTYLGYPGTTGSHWCDYRISDPIATPMSSQCGWSEQLALLSRSMFACEPVSLPPAIPDRSTEGLPAGFVFCAFHTANKIDADVFAVWVRLLEQVPGSVLWLSTGGEAARNLRAEAVAQGLDPLRLVFARHLPSREHHLARLQLADLYLDTPRYNAHTTALEALYAGVPVLTCPSPGPASSVAAGIVHEAGLDALIAANLPNYESRALALATSPVELNAMRQDWERRRATCRLFDPRDLAVEIERAYEHMWARYSAGLPPLAFQLDAK